METITSSVIVPPGGYVVLGINADMGSNGNVLVDYQYSTSVNLNNTSDYLAILDSNLIIIDELTYDEGSGLDPSGASRNLDPIFQSAWDNDDDTYFCEATTQIGGSTDLGTPGSNNDPCN